MYITHTNTAVGEVERVVRELGGEECEEEGRRGTEGIEYDEDRWHFTVRGDCWAEPEKENEETQWVLPGGQVRWVPWPKQDRPETVPWYSWRCPMKRRGWHVPGSGVGGKWRSRLPGIAEERHRQGGARHHSWSGPDNARRSGVPDVPLEATGGRQAPLEEVAQSTRRSGVPDIPQEACEMIINMVELKVEEQEYHTYRKRAAKDINSLHREYGRLQQEARIKQQQADKAIGEPSMSS